jgi:hypothetical protein
LPWEYRVEFFGESKEDAQKMMMAGIALEDYGEDFRTELKPPSAGVLEGQMMRDIPQ